MGIRPNHCQFQGAPRMTLPHLHYHHHHLDPQYIMTTQLHLHHPHHYLDPLYSRTIQFHLHHHHWFNQPHRLELLFYMVRLRPRHILLWPLHRLLITLRPQRIRSLHVSDGVIGWDRYDDLPVAALPIEFRMPDIERYTGIGCPRIHLQLYSAVMRRHRLDEA